MRKMVQYNSKSATISVQVNQHRNNDVAVDELYSGCQRYTINVYIFLFIYFYKYNRL